MTILRNELVCKARGTGGVAARAGHANVDLRKGSGERVAVEWGVEAEDGGWSGVSRRVEEITAVSISRPTAGGILGSLPHAPRRASRGQQRASSPVSGEWLGEINLAEQNDHAASAITAKVTCRVRRSSCYTSIGYS